MEDYVPGAPVDDEARKRNRSLPGQGGVFNTVNMHLYHYAGNNPVKHTDPDGKEVDAAFEVTSCQITKDGVMASGKLTVTDRDTGETLTVDAYSGGKRQASDGVSLPVLQGEYEILEPTPIGYRLESVDIDQGNDIVDGVNPCQELLRLHGPGNTCGCLSATDRNDYAKIDGLLQNTEKSSSTVDYIGRNFFHGPNETTTKYGNLNVVDNTPYPANIYFHPTMQKR
jgi:hypothetical protein